MSGTLQASTIRDSASATNNLTLDSSGNVTVGNNLTVSGTGNTSFSGNVGIGTSSPNSQLQISGSLSGKTSVNFANTSATGYGAYIQGGTSGNYLLYLADYAGTNRLLVDGGGNVGIGTSSPANKLHVKGTWTANEGQFQIDADSGQQFSGMTIQNNGTYKALLYNDNTNSWTFLTTASATNQPLLFGTNETERMRLDSSGYLNLGLTSAPPTGQSYLNMIANGGTAYGMNIKNTSATNTIFIQFTNSSNASAGYITQTGATSISYVATSDYRLKTNVKPLSGALAKVLALNPVSYDWVEDGLYGEGFIAHELQEHAPLAVCGEKDAVYEDGSIKAQGVDYGKLTTVLVAALQEAVAKITALEDRITKLESGI